jgi:competence protein ComEA
MAFKFIIGHKGRDTLIYGGRYMSIKVMITAMMLVFVMSIGSAYAGEKVNINTASAAQLQKVKGIGEKTAAAIVADRKEHGAFKSVSDLTSVKGIGKKKLAKIEDDLKASKSKRATKKKNKKSKKKKKHDKDKN